MEGKTCLITGGSDGIGYVAARELARLGAQVFIVGRNAFKTKDAVERILDETGNREVRYLLADLSSQADVRRLADQVKEQIPRLDVLLNNAGAIFLSNRSSVDGIEMTFALNHLGYFLLTTLLLDLLKDSAPARIVNVSSSSHGSPGEFQLEDLPQPGKSGGYRAYGRSKLCNLWFTYELARRLEGSAVAVNALHPGLVRTNIARNNGVPGPCGQLLYRRPRRRCRQGCGDADLPGSFTRSRGDYRQVFCGLPRRGLLFVELQHRAGLGLMGNERTTDG